MLYLSPSREFADISFIFSSMIGESGVCVVDDDSCFVNRWSRYGDVDGGHPPGRYKISVANGSGGYIHWSAGCIEVSDRKSKVHKRKLRGKNQFGRRRKTHAL